MPAPETYHSSLRRCDLYDNPYNTQVQAHPAIIKQKQEVYAARDSISSGKAKQEKELLDTFKQNLALLFSGKFLIIGQAGKYIFLAVMLPAYLFFYGIPKWVAIEGFPNLYSFARKISSYMSAKVVAAASYAASAAFAIVRKVTDPILNYIQTKVEKTREFYHHVKQRMQQFATAVIQTAASPFRLVNAKIVRPLVEVFQKGAQTIRKLREVFTAIKEMQGKVRSALIAFPENAAEAFRKISEKIDKQWRKVLEPFAPVARALKLVDEKLGKWFDRVVQVKNHWMDRIIYKPAADLYLLYQKSKERILSTVRQAAEPIVARMRERMEKAADVSRRVKERIENIAESVSSKFRDVSHKVQETLKRYADDPSAVKQDLAQILPQPVIALFTPLALMTQWVVKAPARVFRKQKEARKRIAKIKKKIQAGLARMNQRLFSFLKKSYKKAKPKCLAGVKRAGLVLANIFQVIKEMLKGAFYILRMIFAWLKILFKQGMLLVHETCASWLRIGS